MASKHCSGYFIGLMSGTSADGIDAVLVNIGNDTLTVVSSSSAPFTSSTREAVLEACSLKPNKAEQVSELDSKLAQHYAESVTQLLDQTKLNAADIVAIGNHGQTVNHAPDAIPPFSLQIGNARLLADLTGIPVVSDFRSADIAAGGQGAPLAPIIHKHLLRSSIENRVVVNLGGIANITILPIDLNEAVTGFDTGPANGLMDYWSHKHLNKNYDQDGAWAASGIVQEKLLQQLLEDDYFKLPPPKSTGREHFNASWLERKLAQHGQINPQDVQATLCQLTAISVANDIKHHAANTSTLIVCGGGSHNQELLSRLQQQLPETTVDSSAEHGIDPDFVEAIAFAWLAYRHMNNLSGNLPSVTGASKEVILGEIKVPLS